MSRPCSSLSLSVYIFQFGLVNVNNKYCQAQGYFSIPVTSSEVYKAQRGHPESGVRPNQVLVGVRWLSSGLGVKIRWGLVVSWRCKSNRSLTLVDSKLFSKDILPQVGPWSHCSVTCGIGLQSRLVACRRVSGEMSSRCDISLRRTRRSVLSSDIMTQYNLRDSKSTDCWLLKF